MLGFCQLPAGLYKYAPRHTSLQSLPACSLNAQELHGIDIVAKDMFHNYAKNPSHTGPWFSPIFNYILQINETFR